MYIVINKQIKKETNKTALGSPHPLISVTSGTICGNRGYENQFLPTAEVDDIFKVSQFCVSNKLSGSLMAVQHFFSGNLANFSPHLLLLLNPLNCQHSQSNFLTLTCYFSIYH